MTACSISAPTWRSSLAIGRVPVSHRRNRDHRHDNGRQVMRLDNAQGKVVTGGLIGRRASSGAAGTDATPHPKLVGTSSFGHCHLASWLLSNQHGGHNADRLASLVKVKTAAAGPDGTWLPVHRRICLRQHSEREGR